MPTKFTTPYFRHVGLSSSGRPILNDHEHDIIMKNGIGLYQGDHKVKNYQSGRLYLTNQRVIFVNDAHRNSHLSLDLCHIEDTELYKGFLKSSPKVLLKLRDEGKDDVKVSQESEFTLTWVCPICSFSNDLQLSPSRFESMKYCDSDLPTCNTCGVKSSYDVIANYFSVNNSSIQKGSIDLISFDGSQCPNCTFINHPSMTKCEICGSKLAASSASKSFAFSSIAKEHEEPQGVELSLFEDIDDKIDLTLVKFSFRSGGHKLFYDSLNSSMKVFWSSNGIGKENTQTEGILETGSNGSATGQITFSNGIHGLTNFSQQQNYEDSLLLGKAVQDIDQLMSKAKDLISLSKKYQSFLMKTSKHDKAIDQNFELLQSSKTSLANLNHIVDNNKIAKSINSAKITNALNLLKSGKPSTNTVSKLPLLYLEELARNICDFLINGDILDKKNGIVTFHELYLMYNKARQINLVTPGEIYDAIMKFQKLGLNLKVTQVPLSLMENTEISSYFYIISKKNNTTSITSKIFSYINANPGISIPKLQKLHFGMSFIILKTILDSLVYKGELVIDTTLEGSFYWPNRILDPVKQERVFPAGSEEQTIARESMLIEPVNLNPNNVPDISNIFKVSSNYVSNISSERYKELEDLSFI